MSASVRRRHVEALIERCYAGLDSATLRVEVLRRLRSILAIDAAFFATVDPVTMVFTSAVSEEPLLDAAPLFLANEVDGRDVNRFTDLADAADPVASLDEVTRGERDRSRRFADIMRPLALGDELRVVLRSGGRGWGVMCLHRAAALAGFSPAEVQLVRQVAPHVAEGLRRAQLLADTPPVGAGGAGGGQTGIIVLDAELGVVSTNPAAEHWMAEIGDADWPGSSSLPTAVYATALPLTRAGKAVPEPVRLRTASGAWLTISASPLAGSGPLSIGVLLEPAAPAQLTSVLLALHGLTPAQERVAALVLRGRDTKQISNELEISTHTVQEHLKSVFDKVGVRSRRELVAALTSRH